MRMLIAAALVAAGFAAGLAVRGRPTSPTPATTRAPEAPRVITVRDPSEALLQISDRLAALERKLDGCAATPAARTVPPPAATAVDDGEAEAAAERGRSLVDDAIAAGVWSRESAHSLLQLMPKLTDADRRELASRVGGAINEGRMRLDHP